MPRSKGGPECIENLVYACPSCNSKKGAKNSIEWYGAKQAGRVPRLVMGKFLKLAYEARACDGSLDDAHGDVWHALEHLYPVPDNIGDSHTSSTGVN